MLMMGKTPEPDPYDPEQLLTIQQLSKLTQKSVQTIRNRIAAGKFPAATHKDGRLHRWRRGTIIDFLNGFEKE